MVGVASSRLHWKLEPASEEVKSNVAVLEATTCDGALVSVVVGGVVSTENTGRVTKWVPPALSSRLHWPWLPVAKLGHGPLS